MFCMCVCVLAQAVRAVLCFSAIARQHFAWSICMANLYICTIIRASSRQSHLEKNSKREIAIRRVCVYQVYRNSGGRIDAKSDIKITIRAYDNRMFRIPPTHEMLATRENRLRFCESPTKNTANCPCAFCVKLLTASNKKTLNRKTRCDETVRKRNVHPPPSIHTYNYVPQL